MLTTKAASYGLGGSTAPSVGSTLRYPQTTFDDQTDYVKFTFYDYTAPFSTRGGSGAAATLESYNQSSTGLGSPGATIHLYMPEDIEGEYGAQWNEQNISSMAAGALAGFGKSAGGNVGAGLGSAFNSVKVATSNALTQGTAAAKLISEALGAANFGSLTVNDIFSVTTGQVLNPNTEVLYKGPKMRNFSLNFKMAPRNQTEADSIKKIIQCFKFATLPRYGGQGDDNLSFVKVPQIVDVEFMKGSSSHPWVTQFKPSVITNFGVSYTPDGAWATLPNGSPVATKIKISFQETKMVYADEVTGTGATY